MPDTKSDFRYTSPREKLSIIQAILKQFYEAPTRGNNGKGNLFSASMTQKDIADTLGVSIPTISRLLTDPKFQHLIEAHGITEYRDPLHGGPKRYIYNPESVTIDINAPQEIQNVVDAAKAMLYPSPSSVPIHDSGKSSKPSSSSSSAGMALSEVERAIIENFRTYTYPKLLTKNDKETLDKTILEILLTTNVVYFKEAISTEKMKDIVSEIDLTKEEVEQLNSLDFFLGEDHIKNKLGRK